MRLDFDAAVRVGVEVVERELARCEHRCALDALAAGYDRLVEYIESLEIEDADVRVRLFDRVVADVGKYVEAMIDSFEVERLIGCRGL